MVCEWGMSEKLGMVEYGEHEDYVFLGRDISRSRDYSEATAQEIDREVKKLVRRRLRRARSSSSRSNRDKLEIIAKALLEFETLDGEQVNDIVNTGTMRNPPAAPKIGGRGTIIAPPDKASQPDAPLDLGGLSGAPA